MFEIVNANFSLSEKIEEAIVNAIRDGKLSVGEKLPTKSKFCKQFSLTRAALVRAKKFKDLAHNCYQISLSVPLDYIPLLLVLIFKRYF